MGEYKFGDDNEGGQEAHPREKEAEGSYPGSRVGGEVGDPAHSVPIYIYQEKLRLVKLTFKSNFFFILKVFGRKVAVRPS